MPMSTNLDRDTPTELEKRRLWRRGWLFVLLLLLIVGMVLFWKTAPEAHADIGEHFKYGSIGSDNTERGIPYWIWKVLPVMFPQHLPSGQDRALYSAGGSGYAEFGLLHEANRDRPVGSSKRQALGIDLVGLNCAICHTGAYRAAPDQPPVLVMGMPSNTVDLQGFFQFLFRCAGDEQFTVDNVMRKIQEIGELSWYERQVYPRAIQNFKDKALAQQAKLSYWKDIPPWGPGRVDTFTPYKILFFNMPPGEAVGTSDFPSLWLQRPRQGMYLHWDGNNNSVLERNISAAFGAGILPGTLDQHSLHRIADWILDFAPPKYPRPIDEALAEKGRGIYAQHCAACHGCREIDGFANDRVGTVTPIAEIGTDPHRLESFTPALTERMNTLGAGYRWQFQHFRKTHGYANLPLDGIWLRAPYLHNGSVPTLKALLQPVADRPRKFYRGNDLYDWEALGFVSDKASDGKRTFFEYDTSRPGNGNGGHRYGTELSEDERRALLEYLKTL
jgi:mono/diheme cytochrome c family protein